MKPDFTQQVCIQLPMGSGNVARIGDAAFRRPCAALAGDPQVIEKSGDIYTARELADEYGFADLDGKTPDHAVFAEAFKTAMESGPLAALERQVPYAWQLIRRSAMVV